MDKIKLKNDFFAAIDCGTTTVKAGVFNQSGVLIGISIMESPIIYHKNGFIENNPEILLSQVFKCLKDAVDKSKVDAKKIKAVSITNQRATVLMVDDKGNPLANAINWQDLRGLNEIEDLRKIIDDKRYYKLTGIPNNPVFTLGKILWIKKNTPNLYNKTKCFILVHDFILNKLGCSEFFCDYSNASLTGMMNISSFNWSREILETAGIDQDKLPELVPSGKMVGNISKEAANLTGLMPGTPIISGGGDQQCAGIGMGIINPGIVGINIGTASTSLCCADKPIFDPKMSVTCCAHAVPGKWEIEGLQNSTGASLDWIVKIVNNGKRLSKKTLSEIAITKPGCGGILYYPFLTGASAPYWNPEASALFLGVTHETDKIKLIRSVMEGISFETRQILEILQTLYVPIKDVRLSGGCSKIEEWNQIQADIYGIPVLAMFEEQATLLGAAILSAIGTHAYKSFDDAVNNMVKIRKTYIPKEENNLFYNKIYAKNKEIYENILKSRIFKDINTISI